jgi:hypothetical protein
VFARSVSAEARFNMGLVIATGTAIGTCFTPFVVPAFYVHVAHDRGAGSRPPPISRQFMPLQGRPRRKSVLRLLEEKGLPCFPTPAYAPLISLPASFSPRSIRSQARHDLAGAIARLDRATGMLAAKDSQ